MAKSFEDLVKKTQTKKTKSIAKKRTAELINAKDLEEILLPALKKKLIGCRPYCKSSKRTIVDVNLSIKTEYFHDKYDDLIKRVDFEIQIKTKTPKGKEKWEMFYLD